MPTLAIYSFKLAKYKKRPNTPLNVAVQKIPYFHYFFAPNQYQNYYLNLSLFYYQIMYHIKNGICIYYNGV
jgi:hypothetical protein